MPLSVSRPYRRAYGVFYFRCRIPKTLLGQLKGRTLALPVDGRLREIKASERIVLSLSTHDPVTAKSRHAKALAALQQIFDGLSSPLESARQNQAETDRNSIKTQPADGRHAAPAIAAPSGPACQSRALAELPSLTRASPIPRADFDFSNHARNRIKASEPKRSRLLLQDIYTSWQAYKSDKLAPATLRRYAPSLRDLCGFFAQKDLRDISDDDIYAWAQHRRDNQNVSAGVVNGNDLVAAAALFTFAMSREGGRLRTDNPVSGSRLDLPKRRQRRDKCFRAPEVSAILLLARDAQVQRRYPRASASRRWVPWLCAYSGARVQEICWLRKEDIRSENGIWVISLPMTKDGLARDVPVHDALLEEGFLDFCRDAPDGDLFIDPSKFIDSSNRKAASSRSRQELRASEIGAWIRHNLVLDEELSPNHSWRHTFLTISEAVGISKRMANAIAGHNRRRDASDGYIHPSIPALKRELDKFPHYSICETEALAHQRPAHNKVLQPKDKNSVASNVVKMARPALPADRAKA